jgi:hypothetical protein
MAPAALPADLSSEAARVPVNNAGATWGRR